MSWINYAIKELSFGKSVYVRPTGNSMTGVINHKDMVLIKPINTDTELKIGDILLVKVKGKVFLHLVKAIKKDSNKERYLIGNNRGGINGWTNRSNIYGIVKEIIYVGTGIVIYP